jgi:xanthine dehydrogenase YagS FAD-binding subunit
MQNFTFAVPNTLRQAISLLTKEPGKSKILAGGTDLLDEMQGAVVEPGGLVSLQGIPSLASIKEEGGAIRIGAMATLNELERHPVVRERYPLVAEAASQVATPQLRAQGTIGGNLCQRPRCWYYRGDFPCLKRGGGACSAQNGENTYHAILGGGPCHIVHPSDMAVALMAMDASVKIAGPKGEKVVSLEKFYVLPQVDARRETILGPGEVVTEIRVPRPAAGSRAVFRKIREREGWDFALLSVAARLTPKDGAAHDVRVVLGGVAPVPWRAAKAEQALQGKRLDAATIASAGEAALSDARPLAQNAYKVPMAKGMVRQALTVLA